MVQKTAVQLPNRASQPAPWVRAVQFTHLPFVFVYLLGSWLMWGDGSLVSADGSQLSGLGRWLCAGWVPSSAFGLAGLLWNAHRGGLWPWTARGVRVFALAFCRQPSRGIGRLIASRWCVVVGSTVRSRIASQAENRSPAQIIQ